MHRFFKFSAFQIVNFILFGKWFWRSLAHLMVFGRLNKARYKRGERNGNLNKTHFLLCRVLFFILCAAHFLRVGTLRA